KIEVSPAECSAQGISVSGVWISENDFIMIIYFAIRTSIFTAQVKKDDISWLNNICISTDHWKLWPIIPVGLGVIAFKIIYLSQPSCKVSVICMDRIAFSSNIVTQYRSTIP